MNDRQPPTPRGPSRQGLSWLGRYFEKEAIRFFAVSMLVVCLGMLVVALVTSRGGRTIFGSDLGGDYATFYVAGTILNHHPPDKLYDLELQNRTYHSLLPGILREQKVYYVHAPFFALLFQPLALLPYFISYLVWLAVSAASYAAGIIVLQRSLTAIPREEVLTALLLSVSFVPFVLECWMGGNASTIGFFFIVLGVHFERLRQPVLSGMALSFCLYKPTLLLLLLPMLALGRRGKSLLGFATGSLLLAAVSVLILGREACGIYVEMLWRFVSAKSAAVETIRTFKYVDLVSCVRLLVGGPTTLSWAIVALIAAVSIFVLLRAWWGLLAYDDSRRDLTWAGTLAWTPVLNLHAGIYDTVIVVAAMFLTANALHQRSVEAVSSLPRIFKTMLALLYLVPWFSQHLARLIGFQIITVVLFASGLYQLWLAAGLPRRSLRPPSQGS